MLNVPLSSALLRLHSRHSVTRQIIRGSQNRTRMFACSADSYRIRQTLWLMGCRWNVSGMGGTSAFHYPFHLQSRNLGKIFGVTLYVRDLHGQSGFMVLKCDFDGGKRLHGQSWKIENCRHVRTTLRRIDWQAAIISHSSIGRTRRKHGS